jgi:hypothetical protein
LTGQNLARAVACPSPVLSRPAQPRSRSSPVILVSSFCSCSCSSSSSWAPGEWSVQKCHRRRHPQRRRPCTRSLLLPPAAHLPTCPPPTAAAASCISQPASRRSKATASYPVEPSRIWDCSCLWLIAAQPSISLVLILSPRARRLWTTLRFDTQRYLNASSLPCLTLPDCYLTLPCTHAGSSLCPVQLHYYIPHSTVCLLQT